MKRQRTKKNKHFKDVKLYNHIMTRCEARWGFIPTIGEIREMASQVKLGKSIFIGRATLTRSYHIVVLRNIEIPIVFSKISQLPVSVYPVNSLVEWRLTEKYKRAKGLI
jgi:hypothetical protein